MSVPAEVYDVSVAMWMEKNKAKAKKDPEGSADEIMGHLKRLKAWPSGASRDDLLKAVQRGLKKASSTTHRSTPMDPLRRATIRLANQHPKGSTFRKALLDVLAEDFNPDEIGDLDPGPLEGDADEAFMKGEFTQQEFDELSDKQVSGQLPTPDRAASDKALRTATIRLASKQPQGSKLRKKLLAALKN